MLPERMVDIAIVQKEPNLLAEPLPDRFVATVTLVELHERREKQLGEPALASGAELLSEASTSAA